MSQTDQSARQEDQLDPLDIHRQNIARMADGVVAIPSYPGAGAALLGNMLLELGLNYFDPYTEVLRPDGSTAPLAERLAYRARLAGSFRRDQNEEQPPAQPTLYCKTHLYPDDFRRVALGGIVVLTRDPRDAIYSYYNWRLGFSEEGERGSFEEFLQRGALPGRPPVKDWVEFYQSWLEAGATHPVRATVRFEDLKTAPVQTVAQLLQTLSISRTEQEIERAVEQSSFERMRQHEDRVAADDPEANTQRRIMRRGKIDEWQEWYGGALAAYFEVPALRALAQRFGYRL